MATRHIGVSDISGLLVSLGTEVKIVFNYVMSQKQKNCVPSFLCDQVWERCQKKKKSGNAEFKVSIGSLFHFVKPETSVSSLLQAPQLLPLLPSRWALPVPGPGVLQHQAITDRNVYLTNVLKPVCTSSVSFCSSVLCISCVCGFA